MVNFVEDMIKKIGWENVMKMLDSLESLTQAKSALNQLKQLA
jgi:hypothetical protein